MFHQTSMKCVHSALFAALTHVHFSLSACCQKCCGTPQRDNTGKSGGCRQTGLFATLLTNTHTHTHTYSSQQEVVLKPWQTVQPAEPIHGELLLFCCLMQVWVINSDKSFSNSLLMCPQHQHTHKHAIHIYYNSSHRRVWGRRECVNRVNVEKIVSRCARGNLRLFDRMRGFALRSDFTGNSSFALHWNALGEQFSKNNMQ